MYSTLYAGKAKFFFFWVAGGYENVAVEVQVESKKDYRRVEIDGSNQGFPSILLHQDTHKRDRQWECYGEYEDRWITGDWTEADARFGGCYTRQTDRVKADGKAKRHWRKWGSGQDPTSLRISDVIFTLNGYGEEWGLIPCSLYVFWYVLGGKPQTCWEFETINKNELCGSLSKCVVAHRSVRSFGSCSHLENKRWIACLFFETKMSRKAVCTKPFG